MKRYKCIKPFANVKLDEVFVETGKDHEKWEAPMYIKEGTKIEDNAFLLNNHVEDLEYFIELN